MQINGFGGGDTAEITSGLSMMTGDTGIRTIAADQGGHGSFGAVNGTGQDMRAGTQYGSAFAVDLDGDRSRTGAYAEKKRSMQDVMTEAANTDSSLRHNFMNLMANTLSDEDFAKGMEEGFDFSATDPAETVTILDHIKAAVALSGADVKGFTDDLDVRQLENITGSLGMAEKLASSFTSNDIPLTEKNVKEAVAAADRMSELTPLTDNAVVYMVENDLEPTIDNLYMAEHSTGEVGVRSRGKTSFYVQEGGYYAQRAQAMDWENLKDQVKGIAVEAGLDPDDETVMAEARQMIDEGLPLTPGNLEKVVQLKSLELPIPAEEAVDMVVSALAGGRPAETAKIGITESDLEMAARFLEEYKDVTDEELRYTIAAKKMLNLKSFREAAVAEAKQLVEDGDPDLARARKDLEHVRLTMSVEANLRLIRLGMQIDTAPLKELVKALDEVVADMERSLFMNESLRSTKEDTTAENEPVTQTGMVNDRAGTVESEENDPGSGASDDEITAPVPAMISGNKYLLFKESIVRVDRVRTAPVEMVGRLSVRDGSDKITLNDICETGEHLRERHNKAEESYEALMTSPRADLGDSIKKAFRNVDDILEDLNFELSDENRRVVRILGYNHMELTPENIEKVRAYDRKLVSTVDALKPESVLEMIRDGKDPLLMTLDELKQDLDGRQRDDKDGSQEKYAKFLYKLEKNADITSEEKESYIGIYRLFHRLQATDDAAIGALVKTGAEMTLGNLLTAVRSNKIEGRGLDVKIDDEFGGMVAGKRKNAAIDEQIRAAFERYQTEADIVYNNLEPEKLHIVKPDETTTLPELSEGLQEAEADLELEREYYAEQAEAVRRTTGSHSAISAAEELSRFDESVTAASIRAMQGIRRNRSGRTNDSDDTMWSAMERLAKKSYAEARQELVETLGEAEDYVQGYKDTLEDIGDELYEMAMDEIVDRIDVAALGLIRRQLSLNTRMADHGSFEVPIEIDGQTVSMHVTIAEGNSDNNTAANRSPRNRATERNQQGTGQRVTAILSTAAHGDMEMSMTVRNGRLSGIMTSSYGSEDGQSEYMEGVRSRFLEELGRALPEFAVDEQDVGILYRTTGADNLNTTGAENGFSGTKELLRMARSFVIAVAGL